MLSLFKRYRELLIVGALLIYPLVTYLSSGHRGREPNVVDRAVLFVSAPVQRLLTGGIESTRGGVDGYIALRGARDERDRCVADLSATRADLNAMHEAKAENERLRAALGYTETTLEPELAARVIGVNASPHYISLRINRGEGDGVRVGMPVLTHDGVVGQVSRFVVGGAADVMLITDPGSRLGAIVQRSRVRATAVGAGGGAPLKLDNVLHGDDVVDGDVLITSGTDGLFPKGLVIGKVQKVTREANAMFLNAEIAPAADLRRLEEVLLLPSTLAVVLPTTPEVKR
ncbi:MAG: rod shape-determining protein MreC [Myxococcaceae bacterium]|nr:rod shape-determining protein MreC [Myxococcaceae bacterium]